MQFTPQRLEKVYRKMRRDDLDALLVTRSQDVHYLTGYYNPLHDIPVGCLLSLGQQPTLLLSELQYEAILKENFMSKIVQFSEDASGSRHPSHSESFWKKLLDVIMEDGIQNGMLGLQLEWLAVRDFERLKTALPNAGFKDFSSQLWRLRQIKGPTEIAAISEATKIAEIGVRTALEVVYPGKTEVEASIEIESAMRAAGGQLRGIRAAILTGTSAKFPFAQPSTHRISNDEPVVVDITVSQDGYFAEVARTIQTSSPNKEQRALFECNLTVADGLEENLTPNASIGEIMDSVMSEAGDDCCKMLIQPVGNGIGLDLQEPPSLSSGSDVILREDMVISLHPTCYSKNAGTTRISDVLQVTSNGCKRLTSLAKETM